GSLYPLNLVFAVVGLDRGYPLIALIHLVIGGVSLYCLCREYGLPVPAALIGSFAFELGEPTVHLATWLPTANLGAYVWMPTAVLLLERTLRWPTLAGGVGLGLVLAFSVLAGNPQVAMFIYQVLALRLLWQLLTARESLGARAL